MVIRILSIFLLMFLSIDVFAADAKAAQQSTVDPWTGKFEIGYNASTGDTIDKNFISKLNATYKTDKWNNTLGISALLSSNADGKDAERYNVKGEANFYFHPNTFVFARTNNTYDYFAAFDVTFSNSMGFGYRLFSTENTSLDIQAGPGDLRQRENSTKEFSDELTLFVKETFNWQLSQSASLSHFVSVDYGSPNIHIEGQVALNTTIVGAWGLSLSYNVVHDSYIPPNSSDKNKTDTLTDVTVSYNF